MYDFLLVLHCNYSSILYHLRVIWRWISPKWLQILQNTDVIIYNTNKFLPLTHVLLAVAILLVILTLLCTCCVWQYFNKEIDDDERCLCIWIMRSEKTFDRVHLTLWRLVYIDERFCIFVTVVTEMLVNVLNICSDDELMSETDDTLEGEFSFVVLLP